MADEAAPTYRYQNTQSVDIIVREIGWPDANGVLGPSFQALVKAGAEYDSPCEIVNETQVPVNQLAQDAAKARADAVEAARKAAEPPQEPVVETPVPSKPVVTPTPPTATPDAPPGDPETKSNPSEA